MPYVFTEHGAVMAANILKSDSAIQMSVFVVRAFIKMREAFTANKTLAAKLVELEKKLTSRMNIHEKAILHVLSFANTPIEGVLIPLCSGSKNTKCLLPYPGIIATGVIAWIQKLMAEGKTPELPKRKIGFTAEEKRAAYAVR